MKISKYVLEPLQGNNNDNHSKHPEGDHTLNENNNGTPKGVTHPYVYFDNEESVQRQPTSKW